MKSLFDSPEATDILTRLEALKADSPRLWGTMTPAQAMAHCAGVCDMAVGTLNPPRAFVGRLLGPLVKRLALDNDKPFGHGSPTAPQLVVKDDRQFETERTRLGNLLRQFIAGGRAGCSTHPHTFFGRLTPDDWGHLLYKHTDHHLRQFGV